MISPEFLDEKGNVRSFTIRGAKGSIQLAITYTDRSSGKREYQVSKINTGAGWTRECPDMPGILKQHIGETYTGSRVKWLESVYHSTEKLAPPPPPGPREKSEVDLGDSRFHRKVQIGTFLDVVAQFDGKTFDTKAYGLQPRQVFTMSDRREGKNLWLGLGKYGSESAKQNGISYSVKLIKGDLYLLTIESRRTDGISKTLTLPAIEFRCQAQHDLPIKVLGKLLERGVLQFKDSQTKQYDTRDVDAEPLEWDEELDGQSTHTYRKDQVKLRGALLAGRSHAPCAICGGVFPEEFLWAAHLKKRSACTDKEKRDHANIARLMCKFGCDDLYEKGYLGVVDGKIRILRQSDCAPVKERIQALEGRTCTAWNQETSVYFKWHYDYFCN